MTAIFPHLQCSPVLVRILSRDADDWKTFFHAHMLPFCLKLDSAGVNISADPETSCWSTLLIGTWSRFSCARNYHALRTPSLITYLQGRLGDFQHCKWISIPAIKHDSGERIISCLILSGRLRLPIVIYQGKLIAENVTSLSSEQRTFFTSSLFLFSFQKGKWMEENSWPTKNCLNSSLGFTFEHGALFTAAFLCFP